MGISCLLTQTQDDSVIVGNTSSTSLCSLAMTKGVRIITGGTDRIVPCKCSSGFSLLFTEHHQLAQYIVQHNDHYLQDKLCSHFSYAGNVYHYK